MDEQHQRMSRTDLDRYSIRKIDEHTFELTDADTLQTWQIDILTNIHKENEAQQVTEKSKLYNS